MFLGRSETPLARQHRYKTCRYYDTIVSKTPQPKKTLPTKSTWHSRLPMCKKCQQADQVIKEEKTNRLKKSSRERMTPQKERLQGKPDCEQRQDTIINKCLVFTD